MANIKMLSEEEALGWDVPYPDNKRFKNIKGEVFGKLTAYKYYGKTEKCQEWICRCDCGNYQLKTVTSLKAKSKFRKQCWECTKKDKLPERFEVFLDKAKGVHGDRYDYSKAVFKGDRDKITIVCQLHGDFKQTPNCHISGKGCRVCGRLKANANHRNSFETFLERSKKAHEEFYDYGKVVYKNSGEKVIITCPLHGDFEQIPKTHWKGQGCPKCRYIKSSKSLMKTTEEFIKDAKGVHGDRYNYHLVDYKGAGNLVSIECPIHGIFEQKPSIHLCGFGCGSCSTRGYNEAGGGFFYITTLNDEYIKYGITSKDPRKRMEEHSRHSRFIHGLYSAYFFEDGSIPKRIESYVKNFIGKGAVTKDCLPDGYTETTTINNLAKILDIVQDFQGEPIELY